VTTQAIVGVLLLLVHIPAASAKPVLLLSMATANFEKAVATPEGLAAIGEYDVRFVARPCTHVTVRKAWLTRWETAVCCHEPQVVTPSTFAPCRAGAKHLGCLLDLVHVADLPFGECRYQGWIVAVRMQVEGDLR